MEISVKGVSEGQPVPEPFAFGVYDEKQHMRLGENRNPEVSWKNAPLETKSFAIVMKDPDVPSQADDVNQEGKTVSKDIPRVDFYHWLLVDIPPGIDKIEEGEDSDEVVAKGKPIGKTEKGLRGANTYTHFLAGDANMEGTYGGYDGPCPPWNDEIIHHYEFTVYALDVETLGLEGAFEGPDVEKAIEGHVLDKASVTGTYTLNPDLR
ncbi:YbhB/YbcL family Raf kinase inhibitor-like protein [Marinobacteraceae bacterium S3BR75-40.1]